MEHFNDSITAGEKSFRNSRSSMVFIPKAKSLSDAEPVRKGSSTTHRAAPKLVSQSLIEEEETQEDSHGKCR